MIDGNTAALERYMNEQDDADRKWKEYNTPSNRWEAEQFVAEQNFDSLCDYVIEDLSDEYNQHVVAILSRMAKCGMLDHKLKGQFITAIKLAQPHIFDSLVEAYMMKRAGLE
jgi:hypothetical protein